jgi:hypothetical protein
MRKTWAVALAVLGLSCNQAIFTAPSGSTMTVVANPGFIAANGDISVITAVIIEPSGQPVVDGTVVQFFTNLGRIDAQAKTNDGVAHANLQSDVNSGTATITAISGDVTNTDATVAIGSARPAAVIVSADPPRIEIDTPQRRSRLTANVLDTDGNPIRNVPVFFSIDPGAVTESLASHGQPVFTDSNGQAHDFLQTSYPKDGAPVSVVVTATTANGITGTVTVTIN